VVGSPRDAAVVALPAVVVADRLRLVVQQKDSARHALASGFLAVVQQGSRAYRRLAEFCHVGVYAGAFFLLNAIPSRALSYQPTAMAAPGVSIFEPPSDSSRIVGSNGANRVYWEFLPASPSPINGP
jgi:hypothetical protein